MRDYVIRRIGLIIPTLILATMLVFLSVRFIPGDVIELMMVEHRVESVWLREVTMNELRQRLGLDVPIYVQYGRWVSGVVRGDLGKSLWTGKPITQEIASRFPISFELGIIGVIVGLIIALPIGIYSAIRQDTWSDYVGRSFSILCISVPGFWLGTLVIVFPSIWWGWMPDPTYIPFTKDPIGNLEQFIIPAIVLGMGMSGLTMRMTRTMMLEVLRQDYIRTAWAKGLSERTVIFRHGLKNALIPVVTLVGFQVPVLIGGTVIIEQIFSLPGMGRYFLDAIVARDYTAISGVNVVLATVVLFNNLLIDLTYGYLDPRVHYR